MPIFRHCAQLVQLLLLDQLCTLHMLDNYMYIIVHKRCDFKPTKYLSCIGSYWQIIHYVSIVWVCINLRGVCNDNPGSLWEDAMETRSHWETVSEPSNVSCRRWLASDLKEFEDTLTDIGRNAQRRKWHLSSSSSSWSWPSWWHHPQHHHRHLGGSSSKPLCQQSALQILPLREGWL